MLRSATSRQKKALVGAVGAVCDIHEKPRIRLSEKLVMPTAAIWSATLWLAMKFFHHGSVAMSTASSRESSAHRFSAVHAAVCAALRRGPSSCARTACSPATSMRIAQRRGGGALGTMVSMARRGCTALSVCAVRGESTARHKGQHCKCQQLIQAVQHRKCNWVINLT